MEMVNVLSGRWLMGWRQLSADLWVLAAGQLAWVTFPPFFFLWFVDCGSEAGTNGGHQLGRRCWLLYWLGDKKLMLGLGEYTDCKDWFGLVQDLMGQKLERYYHLWLACSF